MRASSALGRHISQKMNRTRPVCGRRRCGWLVAGSSTPATAPPSMPCRRPRLTIDAAATGAHWMHGTCMRRRCTAASASAQGPAAATSPEPTGAGAPTTQQPFTPCIHDVLLAKGPDGEDWYLEVLPPTGATTAPRRPPKPQRGGGKQQAATAAAAAAAPGAPVPPGRLQVACRGMVYSAAPAEDGGLVLTPQGRLLTPEHPIVRGIPGWAEQLQRDFGKLQQPQSNSQIQANITQQQQDEGGQQGAAAADSTIKVSAPMRVSSAAALAAAVAADPATWCGGTAPESPPLEGLDRQTLCAGELAALLQGSRGVAMVQLHVGWDLTAPQPVENPLALHFLTAALSDPEIIAFASKAPGGLGLSLMLAAREDPFRQWAAHLASFGAQAGVVAESPYYKMLIGRILGYSEANIMHHIRTTNGRSHPSAEVVAAVEKQLRDLSTKAPKLPWRKAGGGGGNRGARRR